MDSVLLILGAKLNHFSFVFRVGKIKRDSFLELVRSSSGMEESDQFREQIKTGKLNVTELYRNNNQKQETGETEVIRVGKLNTKVSNNINENFGISKPDVLLFLYEPLP